MSSHTMVVGCTGMLLEAAIELGRRSTSLTSVARTERSLATLERRLAGACDYGAVALDYRELDRLREAVQTAADRRGAIDLAVGWFHTEAPARCFAEALSDYGVGTTQLVHVVGSAAADPTTDDDTRSFRDLPGIVYQRVTLGFVREGRASRWLTHAEIVEGVLRAVDGPRVDSVVGVVRPWSARPGGS